eukprot:2804561-Amphidinium_carterae.1
MFVCEYAADLSVERPLWSATYLSQQHAGHLGAPSLIIHSHQERNIESKGLKVSSRYQTRSLTNEQSKLLKSEVHKSLKYT